MKPRLANALLVRTGPVCLSCGFLFHSQIACRRQIDRYLVELSQYEVRMRGGLRSLTEASLTRIDPAEWAQGGLSG